MSREFAMRVARSHQELGIAPDYARLSGLPLHPEPDELISVGCDIYGRERQLSPLAARAWQAMQRAAATEGIELQLVSAFRSLDYQHQLIANKLARGQSLSQILSVNAAPGYSEHHTGRAVDLTAPGVAPLEREFEDTAAFAWLQGRAEAFGFAMSYPPGNRWGISYEPWHWCWQNTP